MVKKRVLITGGNGYIGSRLSLYLAQKGYAVTPLCYPCAPDSAQWVRSMEKIVVGDVKDEKLISDLSKAGYDVVVHLVSLDHYQSAGDPSHVASVNIIPTWSLLDAFSKNGLDKFVYFSTMQVYGALENTNIDENHTTQPANAYALTHLMGEFFCSYYNRNSKTQCRVVRLSNSYGAPIFVENNCWWLVVNDLCRMAIRDKKIVLQSDGSPKRDFIHGWDVASAVEAIISTDSKTELYHVSSGVTLTIMELAEMVQEIYQTRFQELIEIEYFAQSIPSNVESKRYTIDNSKLKNIGFTPQWSLERGINDLFDFLEQHP